MRSWGLGCFVLLAAMAIAAAPLAAAETPPHHAPFVRIVIDPNPGPRTLEKAFADVDGDGRLDIVIGTGSGVRWYAFPRSGNARDAWVRHDILTSGDAYEGMKIVDLNQDCRPDIVLSIGESVEWLQHPGGDGTGAWQIHQIATGTGHEVLLGDLDGDGKLDVVTSRTRNIDFQNTPTTWRIVPWGKGAPGKPVDGLALLNIRSGKGPVNLVGVTSRGIYWFENPREHGRSARDRAAWTAHRIGADASGGPALATMDVNSDGRIDVVETSNEKPRGPGLVWWQAPRDPRHGIWLRHTIGRTWQAVHQIIVGDFNRDSHLDLLLAEQEQGHDPPGRVRYDNDRVGILYGNGKGRFYPSILEQTGGQNQVAGDIEGDGDLDFVTANHGVYGAPNPIELFVNQLRGTRTGTTRSGCAPR